MSKIYECLSINLQLFAEGGDGGTGANGESGVSAGVPSLQTTGDKSPLANVRYGKQDAQTADVRSADDGVDRNAQFEALIKGEYKDLYDAKVQDTIQKRLKSSKETVDKYNSLSPTLELLGRKYGVDANDIEALNKAIEEDDAYYEDEALEKGVTVEQLKAIKKMERENADLKRQMQEQTRKEESEQILATWMEQGEEIRKIYPSFDLATELQNPELVGLVSNGVNLRTAYEVIHKDEIIPAAMQFTAKEVERKLTNKIISGGVRPVENGMSSRSSAVVKSDVTQLTKADRERIDALVARGERIRF